jgi:hypothetical protein
MRSGGPSPILPSSSNHPPIEEQIMSTTQTQPPQTGIVVSTTVTAGGIQFNHAEGIVVSTATAGPGSGAGGVWCNHAEGLGAR